ncbi:MAG: nitrilase family protein [Balneolales bacterium]
MKKIKTASVQFNHIAGDKSHNLNIISEYVTSASKQGVDLIVFPEMCITGYWHVRNLSKADIESLSERVPSGVSTQHLIGLSKRYQITIGAGLIEVDESGTLYNTYVVAMPNGETAFHRKLHCFISEHMESGRSYTVFDIPQGAKVGILTCYDNNINENARITALKGAEILLAPHQTGGCDSPNPGCMGRIDPELWVNKKKDPALIENEFKGHKGREWLMRWLPSRAHDNGMFLIFSNGVGLDDDEVRTGNAMILDPYGSVLSETCKAENDMVIADLEPLALDHSTGKRWMKSRRPELYKTLTEHTGIEEETRAVRFGMINKGKD